jgi:hypothetical protein
MQVVGAVGQQQHDGGIAQVAPEECHQVARGCVRPVQVLEYEQHGLALAQPGQEAEEVLEQWPRALCAAGIAAAQQDADVSQARAEQFGQNVLTQLRPQVAQRLDKRRVGHGHFAQLQAAAQRGDEPFAVRLLDRGADQPGLADARVAGQQHHPRLVLRRCPRRRAQAGQLVGTSDQLAARHPARHVREHMRKPPASR